MAMKTAERFKTLCKLNINLVSRQMKQNGSYI